MNGLLEKIGIELPIVQAAMAGVSTPALATAVSNAGELGSLGGGCQRLFCWTSRYDAIISGHGQKEKEEYKPAVSPAARRRCPLEAAEGPAGSDRVRPPGRGPGRQFRPGFALLASRVTAPHRDSRREAARVWGTDRGDGGGGTDHRLWPELF
jgi:hypothetical protein